MSSSLSARWSSAKAAAWHAAQPWLAGVNYVPSTAGNTTEAWQAESFDPATVARELGWAAALGYASTRVFLQYLVWKQDPDAFKARFDRFLALAAARGLSVMPVLFDDCAFGDPPQLDPYLGAQRPPIAGMILPSWTPSPGRRLGTDPAEKASFQRYVQDLLASFGRDERVLAWDLFNEPLNAAGVGQPEFLEAVFAWARAAGPKQPVTIGVWNDNATFNDFVVAHSDIVTFHAYTDAQGLAQRLAAVQAHGYPVICTEWMARAAGSRFDTDLPIFKAQRVGCYQWGLVNGRTQAQFPWWNKAGGTVDERTGWFHDILHADGTPYRPDEIRFIRTFLAHQSRGAAGGTSGEPGLPAASA